MENQIKRYYWISFDGIGYSVAYKLLQEGNDVIVAQIQDNKELGNDDKPEEPENKRRRLSSYNGILKKLPMPQMLIQMRAEKNKDECFVVFDFNNLWKYAEIVQKMGFKNGFFPTKKDFEMEEDRDGAKEIVEKHYPELTIGEVHEFKVAEDGIQFIKENPDKSYVLKGYDDSANTVCPDNKNTVLNNIELITQLTEDGDDYETDGFILEEKIIDPMELTPEMMWYNGEVIACTLDIENKPMGAGNEGKQLGCAQDLVIEIDPQCKLAQMAFPPYIHEEAKKRKGLFIFDASILAKGDTYYFGEFCSNRWGWDSFFTELAMCESVSSYFEALMAGQNPFKYKFGSAVRGINLDKGDDRRETMDYRINWLEEVDKQIWLYDLKMKDGHAVNCGCAWDLVCFTGAGNTIESSTRKAYEAEEGFSFSNMFVRPEFDYLSLDYKTSIMNRYNYAKQNNLI